VLWLGTELTNGKQAAFQRLADVLAAVHTVLEMGVGNVDGETPTCDPTSVLPIWELNTVNTNRAIVSIFPPALEGTHARLEVRQRDHCTPGR